MPHLGACPFSCHAILDNVQDLAAPAGLQVALKLVDDFLHTRHDRGKLISVA